MKKTNILFLLIITVALLSCTEENDRLEPSDIESDLLFHYTFDGDTKDKSGNNNQCTPVGVTFTNDRFGNDNSAIHFAGDGDYVELPGIVSMVNSSWSYSLWFCLDSLPSVVNDAWFLSNMDGDRYDDVYIYVDNKDNEIKTYLATNRRIISEIKVDTNSWYHIAVTHKIVSPSDKGIGIYVNGNFEDGGGEFTTDMNSNYIISSISSDGTGRIYGAIDDVRLYTRGLSASEIKLIYLNEKDNKSNNKK